ncbi:MAG: hypothetical protein ACYCVD_02755 [Desulfitobacteriaceae bacterium]
MPKQEFLNGVLQITEDLTDPQDKLKHMEKQSKGKNLKGLSDKEKADLFDAYVDAGIIDLNAQ